MIERPMTKKSKNDDNKNELKAPSFIRSSIDIDGVVAMAIVENLLFQ